MVKSMHTPLEAYCAYCCFAGFEITIRALVVTVLVILCGLEQVSAHFDEFHHCLMPLFECSILYFTLDTDTGFSGACCAHAPMWYMVK